MQKKYNKAKEVFKVKNHLYKVAPHISDVDIRIRNLKNGLYKSQIFVNIPNKNSIVATKVDPSPINCLDKAQHAVLKQIKKALRPRFKRQTIRKIELDIAA